MLQSVPARRGQWQEALTLFEAMPKAQIQGDVISYNAAISACAKGGQWQEALTLFHGKAHGQLQPNRVTLNALFDSPAIQCLYG